MIVTSNVKDFPEQALAPLAVEAQHPDDFVLHLLALAPDAVLESIARQAAGLRRRPTTVDELLDKP